MSFYTSTIVKSASLRTQNKVKDLGLLEPVTRAAVLAIVAGAKAEHGLTLIAFETYRSCER